jgi:hypothetical protein
LKIFNWYDCTFPVSRFFILPSLKKIHLLKRGPRPCRPTPKSAPGKEAWQTTIRSDAAILTPEVSDFNHLNIARFINHVFRYVLCRLSLTSHIIHDFISSAKTYQNTFDDCDIFEKAAQLNVNNQDITISQYH